MSDDETPSGDQPAAADGEPTDRGPLRRSRRHRMLAGVCGGLGEHFGLDPVIFRIGFAALVVLGGSGILLYILAWLLIPEEGHHRSLGEHVVRRGPRRSTLGVVLIVIAGVLVLHDLTHAHWVPAAALVALGVALLVWREDRGPRPPLDSFSPPTAPDTPPVPQPPASTGGTATLTAPAPPVPPRRRERRERSPLGRTTFSVILIAAGAAVFLNQSDAFHISLEGFLAVALMLTGLGLVVGAWWGRARGLIALGIVITLVLGAASVVDVPLKGGIGDRRYVPSSASELRREYHLSIGQLTLDLTHVPLRDRVVRLDVSVGLGQLELVVPDDVTVRAHAQLGAGNTDLFGHEDNGVGIDVRRTASGVGGQGRLVVELHAGLGHAEVRRAAA